MLCVLYTKTTLHGVSDRLGQIPRKTAILNFCRQTRGKVGKHTYLDENYALNLKNCLPGLILSF